MASDGSVVIDVSIDTERLATALESLSGVVSAAGLKMGAGFSDVLSAKVTDSVTGAYGAALAAVSGAGFENVGGMVSQGLANGIRGGASLVAEAAKTVMNNVKGLVADAVEVRSPSRWAAGIGEFIDLGLAEGIEKRAVAVEDAARLLMDGLSKTVENSAMSIASLEIQALDAVIEAERNAVKERERNRQLELRQRAVDIAVDEEVRRMAIEHLHATEKEYALADLEAYRRGLADKLTAFEEYKQAQAKALQDISYEERKISYEDYELKIKLYNDEYLEKVRTIDEGLYAFLNAKNAEMEAVIERIALEDSATAERLAAILEEKNAIIEKSRVEKELREERQREERETELIRRIWSAETFEEQVKRQEEYNKWRNEEEYRAAEKGRQERIAGLESEYRAIIDTVKLAQEEINNIRAGGDAAIAEAANQIRAGIVDLDAEKENLELSASQQAEYLETTYGIAAEYFAKRAALVGSETAKEHAFMQNVNNSLVALFRQYIPLWYDVGAQLMANLHSGLTSRLHEVNALLYTLRAQIESLNIYSSIGFDSGYYGGIPMYGTGGVVTTPRLAVVGDVPEAIIPLARLNDIITKTALAALPYIAMPNGVRNGDNGGGQVYVNQTNNIYQPVKSPAETARAIKNMSRGLAWGM